MLMYLHHLNDYANADLYLFQHYSIYVFDITSNHIEGNNSCHTIL